MPKVSVIMPVYNGARFVRQAIESVLAQDFQDWELIVINDGSTDGTAGILAGFSDGRIHVIHQCNGGEAVARNRGLDTASGEYVAFLDADDLYLPNALKDMSACLDVQPGVDALYADGYFCDEGGQLMGRLSEVRPGPFTGHILEPLLLDAAVITVPICTMTRRSAIADSGVRFDPSLVIGPDWDFWIHLARSARFGCLDRLTCLYRVHQTNITLTSGVRRRRTDLLRGRLKVMSADWFEELSIETRHRFFYHLLVVLLDSEIAQQDTILQGTAFQALPTNIRANLLRLVASQYLLQQQNIDFARQCLQKSLTLQPASRKGRLLLKLTNRSPSLTVAILTVWRAAHIAQTHVRTFGQGRPKSVPAALVPKPKQHR